MAALYKSLASKVIDQKITFYKHSMLSFSAWIQNEDDLNNTE